MPRVIISIFAFNDTPDTLEEWITASQRHQTWATRLQTEVMRRSPNIVSMAIHVFIDAWPAGWMKTIMDCERRPKPAFFAYRDALAPLLLSLRGDRDKVFAGDQTQIEVWLCDDRMTSPERLYIRYQIEGLPAGSCSGEVGVESQPNISTFLGHLLLPAPEVEIRTPLCVRTQLVDEAGAILSESDFHYEVFPAAQTISHSGI